MDFRDEPHDDLCAEAATGATGGKDATAALATGPAGAVRDLLRVSWRPAAHDPARSTPLLRRSSIARATWPPAVGRSPAQRRRVVQRVAEWPRSDRRWCGRGRRLRRRSP
jgi:hypothetical protein